MLVCFKPWPWLFMNLNQVVVIVTDINFGVLTWISFKLHTQSFLSRNLWAQSKDDDVIMAIFSDLFRMIIMCELYCAPFYMLLLSNYIGNKPSHLKIFFKSESRPTLTFEVYRKLSSQHVLSSSQISGCFPQRISVKVKDIFVSPNTE